MSHPSVMNPCLLPIDISHPSVTISNPPLSPIRPVLPSSPRIAPKSARGPQHSSARPEDAPRQRMSTAVPEPRPKRHAHALRERPGRHGHAGLRCILAARAMSSGSPRTPPPMPVFTRSRRLHATPGKTLWMPWSIGHAIKFAPETPHLPHRLGSARPSMCQPQPSVSPGTASPDATPKMPRISEYLLPHQFDAFWINIYVDDCDGLCDIGKTRFTAIAPISADPPRCRGPRWTTGDANARMPENSRSAPAGTGTHALDRCI